MKWLMLLAGLGAAAVAVEILLWERRRGRRAPSAVGQMALAVLTGLLLAGAVLSAHLLGIFSVPLVAVAFVPVGVGLRWLVLATRDARARSAGARAASSAAITLRARLAETLALPLFVVLVVAVVAVGLIAGALVGPH